MVANALIGLTAVQPVIPTGGDARLASVSLAVALALVGLLPVVFMTLTSFVKISTVFHIARSALGASEVPSGTVILALSAALTVLVMAPVGQRLSDRAMPLFSRPDVGSLDWARATLDAVKEPLVGFLESNAERSQKNRFYELAKKARKSDPGAVTERDFAVVIPAFLVTELSEAFALGFAIFLPFLMVDLLVANVLTALGMQTLSSAQVSLPFKLLLFVAADGWTRISEALVTGYSSG